MDTNIGGISSEELTKARKHLARVGSRLGVGQIRACLDAVEDFRMLSDLPPTFTEEEGESEARQWYLDKLWSSAGHEKIGSILDPETTDAIHTMRMLTVETNFVNSLIRHNSWE